MLWRALAERPLPRGAAGAVGQGSPPATRSSGRAGHAQKQQAGGTACAGMRGRRWAGCGQQAWGRPSRESEGPLGTQASSAGTPPNHHLRRSSQGLRGQLAWAVVPRGTAREPWGPGPLLRPTDRPSQAELRAAGERSHVVDWAALCRQHCEFAHGWPAGQRIDAFELW